MLPYILLAALMAYSNFANAFVCRRPDLQPYVAVAHVKFVQTQIPDTACGIDFVPDTILAFRDRVRFVNIKERDAIEANLVHFRPDFFERNSANAFTLSGYVELDESGPSFLTVNCGTARLTFKNTTFEPRDRHGAKHSQYECTEAFRIERKSPKTRVSFRVPFGIPGKLPERMTLTMPEVVDPSGAVVLPARSAEIARIKVLGCPRRCGFDRIELR